MISFKSEYVNYLGQTVRIVESSYLHILENHGEITSEIISETLSCPDLVLLSQTNPHSELYFLKKKNSPKLRFALVIVKQKSDGLWVSTAMTRSKVSSGTEIYRRNF